MAVHPDVFAPVLPAAFLAARQAVPAVHLVPDEMADAVRSVAGLPVAAHSVVGRRVVALPVSALPNLLLPVAAQSVVPVALEGARVAPRPVVLRVPRVLDLLLPVLPPPVQTEPRRVLLVSLEPFRAQRLVAPPLDVSPEPPDALAQLSALPQALRSDARVLQALPLVLRVLLLQAPPELPEQSRHARGRELAPPVSRPKELQPPEQAQR